METAPVIIFVGVLVFLAHWFSGIFSRTRVPDVLMLILVGVLLGPVLKIVSPEDFGAVGPVFVTVALVIILFDGGIGLHPSTLRTSLRDTLLLTIIGFVVSMLLIGAITAWTTSLGWIRSLMLGAILGGTSSAVVVPLVRQLRMSEQSKTVLMLESVLTDVLCIIVALGLLDAYMFKEADFHIGTMIGKIVSSFLLAAMLGIVGAFVWSILLHRVRTLQYSIFTTPAFVFVLYGLVELLGYSGAISSLTFGFAIGNAELFNLPVIQRYIPRKSISLNETEKVFFAEAVFLIKTFFFVYVGLSIKLADFWSVYFGLFLTLAVFLSRILVVQLSIQRSVTRWDASFMAVMVPKGLAPAVLASIPLQRGMEGGAFIQNATFAVVLFSILLNSLLIFLLDKTSFSKIYQLFFAGYANEKAFSGEQLTEERRQRE
jgi:NhaP-type Na+/H+ or K+/H+ antiporter